MTTIACGPDHVQLRFPGWEALMVWRTQLWIPRSAIRDLSVEPGWSSEILGLRSGLVISGHRKLGVFTHPSGLRRLVSMRRGPRLLRIGVDRAEVGFDEILLSTDRADSLVARLRTQVHR